MEGAAQEDRFAGLAGPTVAAETIGLTTAGAGEVPIIVDLVDLEPTVFLPEAEVSRPRGLLGASLWQLFVKRAIDLVGSLVALVVLSPFLLAVALIVWLDSPGSPIYPQRRVGRDGLPFTMLKFRSMRKGAHEERVDHLRDNECSGPVFKIRDDPRLTRVGRVIRRLSIDELPQLVNVLAGQMSLVGPRPPLPEECAQYTERELGRLLVKPGLTCRWQVSGRSDVDFDTWVDMDLEYIDTWSLRQDLVLLAQTLPAVFSRSGAY